MSFKKMLGMFLPLLLVGVAAAAVSQLTNVGVTANGNTTTVTLQANGAFTHNEYRPSGELLLVDLAGVNAGTFKDQQRSLSLPGVKSYRVLAYKGATGAEVTRIELTLAPGAQLQIADVKGAVDIHVKGAVAEPSTASASSRPVDKPVVSEKAVAEKPAPVVAKPVAAMTEKPMVAKPVAKPVVEEAARGSRSEAPITVSNVSLVRGQNGMNVEITGPSEAKSMVLTGPDRIVLDVANAIPAARTKNIFVNSTEIKGIRVARYQAEPPVTRIVIDLANAHDYEVVQSRGKITLQIRNGVAVAAAAPVSTTPTITPKPAASAPIVVAETKPVPAPVKIVIPKPSASEPVIVASAQPSSTPVPAEAKPVAKPSDFVFVEPTFKAKPAVAENKPVEPAARAAEAANTMAAAKPPQNIPALPANTPAPPAPNASLRTPAINMALEQQQANAAALNSPQSTQHRYTGEPISVNLKDVDLKDFFRLIHDISGLNIVLDPNVKGNLTLVLDDVPWDQALEIVLANNSLDRQLQGNVLRIASISTLRAEADGRRAQAEAQALAVDKQTVTRFLSYAHAKDVMPTVKRFLSQRGDVIADERTNALIIQDIPSVIPEVDRLLSQLDRKTQEVEIEARVVAATRNFARDIGVQMGFGWGNSHTAVGGASAAGISPLTAGYTTPPPYFLTNPVSGSSGTVAQSAIPLFSNFAVPSATSGLSLATMGATYRLDTVLTMAESRGLLKILSRPRVVTQNNVAANVRQGLRIPVVTQAQLGGPPTVSYVDAFLRLTVTPQITAEGTIFLAVDVENTNADFSRTVNGNPTLITQQATTQVLVSDGGTVVIGGVIQTQNSVATQQVPLLGDLPILGNLFKRHTVSTSTQELIFFLSPKIIQT